MCILLIVWLISDPSIDNADIPADSQNLYLDLADEDSISSTHEDSSVASVDDFGQWDWVEDLESDEEVCWIENYMDMSVEVEEGCEDTEQEYFDMRMPVSKPIHYCNLILW